MVNRILVLLMAVHLFAAGRWMVADGQQTELSAKQIEAIRAAIRKAMDKAGIPGATFAIGLGDKVAWSEGFGYADLENHVPAGPESVYRTASIGKSMTATAAMKLAEAGKLDLSVPIQRYCPSFPAKEWPITTRDLISHTSGIRHYEGPNEQAELSNTRHYDHVSEAIDLFKNDALKQKPGSDMIYTTWGYVVLGCVLEGASGEEYREFMRKIVFEPAGMTKTRDDDPRVVVPNRARGYIFEQGQLLNARWVDMSSKMAAGGFITTASDLVRFMNACMAGRLVSEKTMSEMLEPYRLPNHNGTVDGFGMGWFLFDYHGMKAAGYGGGTPGVSGLVYFIPEKRLAISGIFNLENISFAERSEITTAILDIVTSAQPGAKPH